MTIDIKVLAAGMGDSVILSFNHSENKTVNILIDGGNVFDIYTQNLRKEICNIRAFKQSIDLLIVTHLDQDHIKGIIYLSRDFNDRNCGLTTELIDLYWFNSPNKEKIYKLLEKLDISAAEMEELEKFLHNQPDSKWDISKKIVALQVHDFFGAKLTILSPTIDILNSFEDEFGPLDVGTTTDDYDNTLEELIEFEKERFATGREELDTKFENATSIAFLMEFGGKSILYLGDAIPAVIDNAIKQILNERKIARLKVDAIKLSHHASRKSISWNFLEMVDCSRFLISTNGNKSKLPNKATFAKILGHPRRELGEKIEFMFNYPNFSKRLNFTDSEKASYGFTCKDSNYEHGYHLPI